MSDLTPEQKMDWLAARLADVAAAEPDQIESDEYEMDWGDGYCTFSLTLLCQEAAEAIEQFRSQQGEAVREVKCEADTLYAELYDDNPNWKFGDKLYTHSPADSSTVRVPVVTEEMINAAAEVFANFKSDKLEDIAPAMFLAMLKAAQEEG